MKTNFICPSCKTAIVVGKRLHGSYTCCHCHYVMVLSKEDVAKGTVPFRDWFHVPGDTFHKRPFNKNFKKRRPFNKNYVNKQATAEK